MKHSLSLASLSMAALIALSACGSPSGDDMEGMEGMGDTMLAKDGVGPEITDLATRIRDAQAPEIDIMEGWLETWDDAMGSGTEGHDMGDTGGSGSMEGMVGEDRMSELASAEGTEASRTFLESMVAHHEGAIGMARDEIDNGQNPEAIELAGTIVETQQDEIAEMQELLEGL